jgi:DNA polymerase-3 subunit delta
MVLFLYGEDAYRSREKLKQIEEKFKKTDKSRVNLVKIDGERNQWKNIEKELLSPPFLHDKKLIIVENFLKKKGQKIEEALSFLKEGKIPDGTVVVFREDGVPDARLAIFKFLNKPKQAEKFDLLSPAKLNQWIFKEVETNGVEISQPAAELLSELVGPDLWQMSGEIGKLAAYCQGRGKKEKGKKGLIEIEDVNLFVRGNFDENIFALTDALGQKNKKIFFKILNEQIEAGLSEQYIFSMLVRQFRILLQIKEVIAEDYPFLSLGDPVVRQKIAAELGLHPYVVQKALYQSKNYAVSDLKKIYGKMLEIDMKMKRTNLDPRILLDLLVSKIFLVI